MFFAAFRAQDDGACKMRFVAGGIRAIDHQMVVAGSSVGGNLYFMVMDIGILLS
jgi:hypothetical protein